MKTRVIQKSLVLHKGKLLALRRSKTDMRRPLQWDLPGGFLDDGEAFETGITREVKEESGLEVDDPKLIFTKTEVREWIDENKANHQENCIFLFYITNAQSDQVTISHEHSEFRWMTLNEALENWKYHLHLEVFEHIKANNLLGQS